MKHPNLHSPFARWLRLRMVEMSKSCGELARELGTTANSVSYWRTGKQEPGAYYLPRLARVLHVEEGTIKRKLRG